MASANWDVDLICYSAWYIHGYKNVSCESDIALHIILGYTFHPIMAMNGWNLLNWISFPSLSTIYNSGACSQRDIETERCPAVCRMENKIWFRLFVHNDDFLYICVSAIWIIVFLMKHFYVCLCREDMPALWKKSISLLIISLITVDYFWLDFPWYFNGNANKVIVFLMKESIILINFSLLSFSHIAMSPV